MRYVVRAINMEPECGMYSPRHDEMIAVLDTHDCVVEKYTWSEVHRLENEGIIDDVSGLLTNMIIEVAIKELLDGRLVVIDKRLLYNDKTILTGVWQGRGVIEFHNADKQVMFTLTYIGHTPRFRLWLIWAQKIGNMGYRLVMDVATKGRRNANEESVVTMYLFLDNTGRLSVEKTYYKHPERVKVSIEEQFKLSDSMCARLSLGAGMVY